MMNFLDLSAVSEEERRLIKEILADTNVVIPTAKTTAKTANHEQHELHQHLNQQKQHKTINNSSNNGSGSDMSYKNQPYLHHQDTSISSSNSNNSSSNSNNNSNSNNTNINNINNVISNNANDNVAITSSSSTIQAKVAATVTATTTTNNSAPIGIHHHQQHLQQHHQQSSTTTQGTNSNSSGRSSGTTQQTPTPAPLLPQSRVPPMAGDMNSVIGLDMSSTQPPSYAIPPPHVTFAAPPHVYGRPPIFQSYAHYLIPNYHLPPSAYVPYVIPPNSVVPPRQQVPPQTSQPTNMNNTNNPHSRTHPHHMSQQQHHQQQQHQQHHHHQQQQQHQHQQHRQHIQQQQQQQQHHHHQQQQQHHHHQHLQQHTPHNHNNHHHHLQQQPQKIRNARKPQNKSTNADATQDNSEDNDFNAVSVAQEESSAVKDTSHQQVQPDVPKYPVADSSTTTSDDSVSTIEQCNNTAENNVTESTEVVDCRSSESSHKTGVWDSAASKSWASLFKQGVAGPTGSSSNLSTDFNSSGTGVSDEDSKTQSTVVEGEIAQKSKNNSATSKEQRSQDAAKRALDKMGPRLAQKINTINLKHSLPFLKPRGFINKGNGCYINATLQALIACPPFYNLMKEIGDLRGFRRDNSCTPILDSFAELFLNFPPLDSSKKTKVATSQDQKMNISFLQAEAIEPKCIYNVLGRIKSECLKGAQEDAEEFLSSVLNGLHEEMIGLGEISQSMQESTNQNGNPIDLEEPNEDINNDDNLWREVGTKNRSLPIRTAPVINTLIQEIFGGSLFSIRTAGKDRCGHRSPFFDLQLDISGDDVKSLQDAIKSFTATEIIHDFYCSKTKQKLDAQRRTSLDQLPPILILHLKQFVYSQDHGLKKLMKKIEYPIDFELPESCLNEKNSSDKGLRSSRSYKLLAVVYHEGKEAIKGHYLTDVYHIGSSQWIRCDDSNLKVIASPRIENPDSSRTPYLLFYRRLNTLRAQPGNHDNLKKKS